MSQKLPKNKHSYKSMSASVLKSISDKRQLLFQELASDNGNADIIGPFLNDSIKFNENSIIDDPESLDILKNLLNSLLESKYIRNRNYNQKLRDLNILCANLLAGKDNYPLAISLTRKSYAPTRFKLHASYFTIDLVKLLKQNGWIGEYKGFYAKKISRLTRIWPTNKLLNLLCKIKIADIRPLELVELRDEAKKSIIFEDTEETREIRSVLKLTNDINHDASVKIYSNNRYKPFQTDLVCIFNNDSFEHGGRFYTKGFGYQSFAEDERALITIDGQRTVELDFSGMQPRLLYAKVGIQYPLDSDPYTKGFTQVNKRFRDYLKTLLISMINSGSYKTSVSIGNYGRKFNKIALERLRREKLSSNDLIDKFCKNHDQVSHLFFKNMGNQLMRDDARIALDVIKNFSNDRIPILAIHDSFIVQEKYRERLKQVMHESYRKFTGFDCPIK